MTVASTIALMPVMAHAVDLDSEDQKVSYSLGLILGEKLKQDMILGHQIQQNH